MRIGSCFGIPLKVNPFFILFLLIALYWGRIGEALLLFAIVLWHEGFHVVVAARYKLPVADIELLPFGGVARIEAFLQLNPEREWLVAAAGPLSNLLLVGAAYAVFPHLTINPYWFRFFAQANLGMALFNLIPVLPLDGGRVLRSIMARCQGFARATRTAARLGQVFSVLLTAWAVYNVICQRYNFILVLLTGIMLFFAARNEQDSAAYAFMRYLTSRKRHLELGKVVTVRHLAATAESSLGEVLRRLKPPCYHLVWVVDAEGRVAGFVGELELIGALFEHGLSCRLGSVPARRLP
jgi:stage IV sporulation protein FB